MLTVAHNMRTIERSASDQERACVEAVSGPFCAAIFGPDTVQYGCRLRVSHGRLCPESILASSTRHLSCVRIRAGPGAGKLEDGVEWARDSFCGADQSLVHLSYGRMWGFAFTLARCRDLPDSTSGTYPAVVLGTTFISHVSPQRPHTPTRVY